MLLKVPVPQYKMAHNHGLIVVIYVHLDSDHEVAAMFHLPEQFY